MKPAPFGVFLAESGPMEYSGTLAIAHILESRLGPSYDRFDETQRSRHVKLLQSIRRANDVALHAEMSSKNLWTVTVCTSDRLGALATIAGLFPSYGLNIVSADIFTLRFAGSRQGTRPATKPRRGRRSKRPRGVTPEQPLRKILDIFEVSSIEPVAPDDWREFRSDLKGLIRLLTAGHEEEAREQVIDRVSEAFRRAGGPSGQFFPMSIEVDNEASPDFTQLTIRSEDTLGFLYAFVNALAVLNVNIDRAEIRTLGGEAYDRFWVTELAGGKIVGDDRFHQLKTAAALIKQFTYLLPQSPNPAQALRQFNALASHILSRPDRTRELRDLESTQVQETLAELMGVSQFLWDDFLRMQHENLFPVLVDSTSLAERRSMRHLSVALRRRLRRHPDYARRVDALNRFKDREMFRIDLRHITGRIGFQQFSEELSALAEAVMREAVNQSYKIQLQRFGAPVLDDGQTCLWCLCALGKFGGSEMGYGSDVELVFVYQGSGTTGGPESVQNHRFFGDCVQTLFESVKTRRGGIFEIDLRLRPYGNAGALACTLTGFNDYYSIGGAARQLERMALLKLRPVAGDPWLGAELVRSRDAFVYSGAPLDVQNILHLRRRQADELVPQGSISAKYSPGGLVDIEYYVQSLQIAVGHNDSRVRATNTLKVVAALAEVGAIDASRARELAESYGFLRRLIDALRVVRGHAKDLTIPPADSREFGYLARRLLYGSNAQLQQAIDSTMSVVGSLWEEPGPAGP